MAARTSYAPGTPSWVDIGSPDPEVTNAFYIGLFGWERRDAGPPGATGGYGFYAKGDRIVAGHGPAHAPGVWWTTYISVADAHATAAEVLEHGGTVVAPPTVVMDQGTSATFVDPGGAPFSVWQPEARAGAELVDEPGAFSWSELLTRDVDGAADFYTAVFGWTGHGGPGAPYREFRLDGEVVAGARAIGADLPAQVPTHWNVYFGTEDVDESADLVTDLGGTVRVPPFDIDGGGRVAICGGPHHEGFGLYQFDR